MSSIKQKISNLQITCLGLVLSTAPILVQTLAITAQAQPAPEVAIDRMFRYDSSAPTDRERQLLANVKKWMGAYQRVRKDGNSYLAVFDSGSLPVDAKFKANGSIESMSFGCPISRSLSVNDAPIELRKSLSKCAGFKS